jgi:hypothetical protein
MRVTSVELHPDGSSDVCVLSFRDPRGINPYNIKSMSGLDASDGITSMFYGASANSVAKFFNLSLQSREVVLRVSLNPRQSDGVWGSYSDLRDDLYRMIASSRTGLLDIQFKNGTTVVAVITAFVTKVEANHFEASPEIQMTLNATDPWLKARDITNLSIVGLDPADTLIEDLISTAPHGFSFTATVLSDQDGLTITDPDDGSWSFALLGPVDGFVAGDVLHFSSNPNDKKLYVNRAGVTIYLADRITPGSIWPIIFPRANRFSFDNPASWEWTTISYYQTYWGV